VVRKIVHLRWKQRLGSVPITDRLGLQASTVHAVLLRCRLNRLSHLDRVTGEPIRRYEHKHPGDLLHVDVKKLGKVPTVVAGATSGVRRATRTDQRPSRAPAPRAANNTCVELGIKPKKTQPYRPQTNGKIERFHRTLADDWAFKKLYTSETARLAALPPWIHHYNHHRPHSAIGKTAPITRLDNLPGHHT